MAIVLECINVIIPIATIIEHIGLDGFQQHLGQNDCHDDYLYRTGAMNQIDVQLIIEHWQKLGLKPTGKRDGELYWKDLCVVYSSQGSTRPCNWLEYDPEMNIVRYRGRNGAMRP
ncbi:hypothetical protein [Geobacter pickeringii]|uniref:Uncharacterized protein n=1 Tax=Geobacter pickeringii TaxID=345632 RepID=A0A0B5BA34_9BACT|nr:hypothetical protein [Geobacter pickeringii]AJE03578.1 hypothetical protein GPICK_09630 [Geobacter pickeringii]